MYVVCLPRRHSGGGESGELRTKGGEEVNPHRYVNWVQSGEETKRGGREEGGEKKIYLRISKEEEGEDAPRSFGSHRKRESWEENLHSDNEEWAPIFFCRGCL